MRVGSSTQMSPGTHGRRHLARVVVHRPSLRERRGDRRHEVTGLDDTQGVGRAHLGIAGVGRVADGHVGDLGAEHGDGAVVEQLGTTAGVERTEGGLDVGLVDDEASEDVVDEIDHGVGRPEVGRERHLVGADLIGGSQVLGDVGAAEPVDRLLRVADDEQPARFGHEPAPVGVVGGVVGPGCQPHGDLQLDRIGVLELVEHDPGIAGVQHATDVATLSDEPSGEHEQVVELESATHRPLVRPFEDEPADDRTEQLTSVAAGRFEQALGFCSELELEGLEIVECRSRPSSRNASSRWPCCPASVLRSANSSCAARTASSVTRPLAGFRSRSPIWPMRATVASWVSPGGTSVACDRRGERHERRDVDDERTGIVERHAIVDEVPVGAEVLGDAAHPGSHTEPVELAEFDERTAALDQPAGWLRVVEQAVEQVVPLLLERKAALEFVEHREAGRQPRLDGEVEQQPAGERVQCSDRCVIEAVEGGSRPLGGVARQLAIGRVFAVLRPPSR